MPSNKSKKQKNRRRQNMRKTGITVVAVLVFFTCFFISANAAVDVGIDVHAGGSNGGGNVNGSVDVNSGGNANNGGNDVNNGGNANGNGDVNGGGNANGGGDVNGNGDMNGGGENANGGENFNGGGEVNGGGNVNAGVAVNNGGNASFYLGLSEYNQVPEGQVIAIRRFGIPDEELPVVFFLARNAGVPPRVIVKLRLRGLSWMQIVRRFRLNPEIFYVAVNGPVHYGYYENIYGFHRRGGWRRVMLTDADIINMVNLRFMSEHYHYRPEEIMRMRAEGRTFIVIHNTIRGGRRHWR
jgi:hypothetical protein